jgi:hypothetical protein
MFIRVNELVVAGRRPTMLIEPTGLLGRHLFANLKQHMCVCLLKLAACLYDFIDLRVDLRLIKDAGAGDLLQLRLLVLKSLEERYKLTFIFLEDVVHTVLLVAIEPETLGELIVVPPTPRRSQLQPAVHTARGCV